MSIYLSIIIPTYNKREYLRRTIASYFTQTFPKDRYEIILVDDGSIDKTRELVCWACSHVNLTYVHQEHKGRSAARNIGIQTASGDVLIFTDDDRIATPCFVEEHWKYHQTREDAVVIGSKHNILSKWTAAIVADIPLAERKTIEDFLNSQGADLDRGEQEFWLFSEKEVVNDFSMLEKFSLGQSLSDWPDIYDFHSYDLVDFSIPWILFITGNVSVRKQQLLKVGPFDENFVGWGIEDLEMGYRLYSAGASFVFAPAAINYHQEHGRDDEREWREHFRNYRYFCNKHPRLDVHLYWRLFAGEFDVLEYNNIVSEYNKIPACYRKVANDYYAVNARMCESLGQNEEYMMQMVR